MSLFFAGEIAWDVRLKLWAIRPLTVWAACVTLALVWVAFHDRIIAFLKPSPESELVLARTIGDRADSQIGYYGVRQARQLFLLQ